MVRTFKTLMRQSGHKTVAVLMRYLNPTPEEQRERLFGKPASLAKSMSSSMENVVADSPAWEAA